MKTFAPTRHFMVSLAQIEFTHKQGKRTTTQVRLVQTITPAKGPKHARVLARQAHTQDPEHYHWVMKLTGEYAPGVNAYHKVLSS